jgi:hypothetical protein
VSKQYGVSKQYNEETRLSSTTSGSVSAAEKVNAEGVHPEGFQRAIGKPFGRARRRDSPCSIKNKHEKAICRMH